MAGLLSCTRRSLLSPHFHRTLGYISKVTANQSHGAVRLVVCDGCSHRSRTFLTKQFATHYCSPRRERWCYLLRHRHIVFVCKRSVVGHSACPFGNGTFAFILQTLLVINKRTNELTKLRFLRFFDESTERGRGCGAGVALLSVRFQRAISLSV